MSDRKCTFAGIFLALLVLEASLIGVLKTDNGVYYLSMMLASGAIVAGCYFINKVKSAQVINHQTHWYLINQTPVNNDPLFESLRERM
ncbi:MAG: hypothetical protein ACOX6L_07335 [Syntrophomonadaceae bacterium]|jgi:hypothetical protein